MYMSLYNNMILDGCIEIEVTFNTSLRSHLSLREILSQIKTLLTYSYLLQSKVLEKLTSLQLVKKFPAFYGT